MRCADEYEQLKQRMAELEVNGVGYTIKYVSSENWNPEMPRVLDREGNVFAICDDIDSADIILAALNKEPFGNHNLVDDLNLHMKAARLGGGGKTANYRLLKRCLHTLLYR